MCPIELESVQKSMLEPRIRLSHKEYALHV